MIDHISIKNFATIESTEIDFKDGLNIITGETGSGKDVAAFTVEANVDMNADSNPANL